jgi:hypothetical protein
VLNVQIVVVAYADALGAGDREGVEWLDDRDDAFEAQHLEAVQDGAQGGFAGVAVAPVGASQVPADFDLVVAVW